MNDDLDGRLRWVLALALGSIGAGGTVDLILDRPATWLSFYVIFETLMIAGALVMATTLWLGWWRSAHSAVELRATLDAQWDEVLLWRKLATLVNDVPLREGLADLRWRGPAADGEALGARLGARDLYVKAARLAE